MKIIIVGGDGFCGWPTALGLGKNNDILIIDNLSRRKIDKDYNINSLINISSISKRISTARKIGFKIKFIKCDVAKQPKKFSQIVKKFKPKTIIQFGEQRAAPFSMIGDKERSYTVDNNISGTHNICSTIAKINKKIHLIHLGTMGVYGYSEEMGKIPEGYLDIVIKQTKKIKKILYPSNPGSIYHMTKCMDQIVFQYYAKNWGIKITDLHQGIVWGTQTNETNMNVHLTNRFDYDGLYGTVLNRFLVQAVNNHPLSVYGNGGQTRAFIHISDTVKCIKLALKNKFFQPGKVRIFNQVSETKNILELAKLINKRFGTKIMFLKNPRKELKKNELEVSNKGLKSLGFKPTLLNDKLLEDLEFIAKKSSKNFKVNTVLNSPNW